MKITEEISKSPKLFIGITMFLCIVCVIAGFFVGFQSGMQNYAKILDDNDIFCIEKDNPMFPTEILEMQQINMSNLQKIK